MAEVTYITEEERQSKINEMSNLIYIYNNGDRETIDYEKYDNWVLIQDMLQQATIDETLYSDFLENPSFYKVNNTEIVKLTETEILENERDVKHTENKTKCSEAIENGLVMISDWTENTHKFRTCTQEFADLNAYFSRIKAGAITEFDWHTYIDYGVTMRDAQITELLQKINEYRQTKWSTRATYTNRINGATTVEAIRAIVIDYGDDE